jgi:3-oxoacyl-ACP reductase-like protein
MGSLQQPHDDGIISQELEPDAATAEPTEPLDPKTQSIVDAAIASFAAKHGIDVPAATAGAKPSALQALAQLGETAEHTTFGEKVLALVEKGIGEAHLVEETPVVRALAAIVGEIAEKAA